MCCPRVCRVPAPEPPLSAVRDLVSVRHRRESRAPHGTVCYHSSSLSRLGRGGGYVEECRGVGQGGNDARNVKPEYEEQGARECYFSLIFLCLLFAVFRHVLLVT